MALEFVMFSLGAGLTIGPMLAGMFGEQPAPAIDLNYVRISLGGTNKSTGQDLRGGPVPLVTLYDFNGEIIGDNRASGMPLNKPGEFTELQVKSTITPEYIRISPAKGDNICINWATVTAASGDFRTWNGGFGFKCDVPWYPSSSIIPKSNYRPPCVWIGANPDTPARAGLSWKLLDFWPPDAGEPGTTPKSRALAEQWKDDPETLCKAPGRMQFWDLSGVEDCVPFYPNPLAFDKNGKDADKNYLMTGARQKCRNAWTSNRVPLYDMDGVVIDDPWKFVQQPAPNPKLEVQIEQMKDDGAIFSSTLDLGPLKPPKRALGKRRDGMEFVKARSAEHEKCKKELVLHSDADINVREMCNSPTAWGPDMASDAERVYCDLCEHELYPYCETSEQVGCWDSDKYRLRAPKHNKRNDGSSYPQIKRWEHIHEW